ncbi:hypothetical protein [uncultured Winogradskyella sp.]|uniref:hypothetical protein n=1 Tax=uncultured Winogradskyella sp. TaxID=395353 RepID=UPI00261E2402|nr:hypothetical protein [uncultured Winogradskyella sp.]
MKHLVFIVGDFIYKVLFKCHKAIYTKKIKSKYQIHKSVTFWRNTFITSEGTIQIGKGTYIGQQTYISANPSGSKIKIG